MVVFEILASHHHMAAWHGERIGVHERDAGALQAEGQALCARVEALENAPADEDAASGSPSPGRIRGAAGAAASAFAQAAGSVLASIGGAAEGGAREGEGGGGGAAGGGADADREGSIAAIVERSLQRAVEIKSAGAPFALCLLQMPLAL